MLSDEQRSSLAQATKVFAQDVVQASAYLQARGISESIARSSGLGYVAQRIRGYEHFMGRLAIPYATRAGVVAIKFRSLVDSEGTAKYLNVEGLGTHLYNVEAFFSDSKFLCVTEGEMDTLSLASAGLPAVGVPGVKNWKKYYKRCFEEWHTIFVFADGDQPGKDFAKFLASEIKAIPIYMDDGQDVNSTLCSKGADFLRAKVA